MTIVNQKVCEKVLCRQYWEMVNAGEKAVDIAICADIESVLDLKSVYQTMEHVWRELTRPKDRTSVSTAYCRLVSAIKGSLTLNVLYYHSADDRVPTFRDELVEMLSSRLAARYEELVAPAERALPLIREFVSRRPQQWGSSGHEIWCPTVCEAIFYRRGNHCARN